MDHQSSPGLHGEDNLIPKVTVEFRTLVVIIMSQSFTIRLLISSSWPQSAGDLCYVLWHCWQQFLTFPGHQGLGGEEGPCFHVEALLEQHFGLNEGNTRTLTQYLWSSEERLILIKEWIPIIVIPDIESHCDLWSNYYLESSKEPFSASPVYFRDFCPKGPRDKQLSTKNDSESHWVAVSLTSSHWVYLQRLLEWGRGLTGHPTVLKWIP